METILSQTLSRVKESINYRRSPINSMPVEIFELIFRYAIRWRSGGLRSTGFEAPNHTQLMNDRWRIGQVCRRWRAVSTSIPALWTTVSESRSIQLFLHRSGDMPLDVLVEDRTPHGASLGSYAHRIRDLFIKVGDPISILPRYDLARLEGLTLVGRTYFPQFRRIVRDCVLPIVPPNLPSLRVLTLREVQWFPGVPYKCLTHLAINNSRMHTLGALLTVLKQCTSLERLVLVNVDYALLEDTPSNDVLLPSLRLFTLGITDRGLRFPQMILRYLILPPTITMRISGTAGVIEDLSKLDPFPVLPFTATSSELSIDSGISSITLFLSSPAPDTPSLRLHFYPKSYPQAISVLSALISFSSLERITYRTSHFPEHGDFVLSLLGEATRHDMPRLCALRLVDEHSLWPHAKAFARAARRTLSEHPRFVLQELDVWSPHAKFLALLDLPACGGGLERAAFHCTAPAGALDVEAEKKIAEQVAEQVPYLKLHGLDEPLPRLALPGIDGLEDDYGFY